MRLIFASWSLLLSPGSMDNHQMRIPQLSTGGIRAALQALLLTGSVFLAACGGGGDGGSTAAPSTGSISAIAGTGTIGPGVAADSSGNIFFSSGDTVFKRTLPGEITPASTTTLLGPLGVAADGSGNLFVTQRGIDFGFGNYAVSVRRIDRQGQVTTVSGNVLGSGVSGGISRAIATGPDGSFYVSGTGTLRRVMPDGTVVNVTAPEVRRTISSIAVDGRGNVYFGHDNMVKKIAPGQAEVLLAGSPVAGSADGTGDQARFNFGGDEGSTVPYLLTTLAVDSAGNVYVADNGNHTIRKISPAGVVTTVAGQAGIAGLQTGPLPGRLTSPSGLALQGDKTLYVTSGTFGGRPVMIMGIEMFVIGTLLKIELPSN